MFGYLDVRASALRLGLLCLTFASLLPAQAGATDWQPRQHAPSGVILAAEGVTDDGVPLTLTVIPTRVDGGLQLQTTYVRGDQGMSIWKSYDAGGMLVEALAGKERLRARMWPAIEGGFIMEYDLPDGRQFRIVADPEQGKLSGDVRQLTEALSVNTGVLGLLRHYRRDRAQLGSDAADGGQAHDTADLPGWSTEILGGSDYDLCVTECSVDCLRQCAYECAVDPVFACQVCKAACAIGCSIGCTPKMRRRDQDSERGLLD